MNLPCIVCGKTENADLREPYGLTHFTSHGHYGSTVYDPMDGHFIMLAVCDVCLLEACKKQQVVEGQDMRLVFEEGEPGVTWVTGMEKIPARDQPELKPWKGV